MYFHAVLSGFMASRFSITTGLVVAGAGALQELVEGVGIRLPGIRRLGHAASH